MNLPCSSAATSPSCILSSTDCSISVWVSSACCERSNSSACRESSSACPASRSSVCFRSLMSVFVPNQRTTRFSESLTGMTRVRNMRKCPSAPRSGNSMSNGSPDAIELFHPSSTLGSMSASWTLCHPHPCICSKVVPVYSYQRALYQKMCPSASAIQASCWMPLAIAWKRSSLSRNASSARLRSVISARMATYCCGLPSGLKVGTMVVSTQ